MFVSILRIIGFVISLTWLSVCQANEKLTYQNWAVELGSDSTEAYTANESASSFGLFCGGTTCVFYLKQNINCVPNTKNAVLMNTGHTSAAIGMQCTLVGKYYFQILDNFDLVFNAVKIGESIGFAVALQGGAFSVARFSLQGAMPAIQKTIDLAARKKLQPAPNQNLIPHSRPGFKDITLWVLGNLTQAI